MKRFFLICVSLTAILFLAVTLPFAVTQARPYEFPNPIQSNDLIGLIESLRSQLFPFAITLVSVAILYIGFRMVVAVGSGNASDLTKWRKFLVYALIGAAIIAGSKPIIDAVRTFVQGIY